VWDIVVLVPILEKAPQLEPKTLPLHLEQIFPDQEWYRCKHTLQHFVEKWRALYEPAPSELSGERIDTSLSKH